jgi:multimeric flavodoxin WrbA
MDRRDFIKSGMMAAAAVAATGPAVPFAKAAEEDQTNRTLKTMKTLLVNGSPHKNGNTATALAEVAKSLNAEGIETEVFWIGAKPVRGCIACNACSKLRHCTFDDDVCNDLIAKMAEADSLVVGTPVYYGQPNGALMALVQRSLKAHSSGVAGKPVACVAVCRRGGATAAIQCLNMPFLMLDCQIVGSQYWNIAYGLAQGEAAKDAEGMQTMRRIGANMAWLLKNLRREGAVPKSPREPWAPMHFIR